MNRTSNKVIKVSIKHEISNLFFECIFLCPANSSCRKLFVVLVDVLLNHFGLTLLWRGFQKIKRIIKMSGRILWICNTIKCTYLLNRLNVELCGGLPLSFLLFIIVTSFWHLTPSSFTKRWWSSKRNITKTILRIHTWKQFKSHKNFRGR